MLGGERLAVHLVGEESGGRFVPVSVRRGKISAAVWSLDHDVHGEVQRNACAVEIVVVALLIGLKMAMQTFVRAVRRYTPVLQHVAE